MLFVFCYCLDDCHPLYQVAVDKEFLGVLALRCSSNKVYHLPPHCLIYLSHRKRVNEMWYHPRRYQSLSSSKFQSSYSSDNRDMTPSSSRQVRSCEHYKHKAQGDNKKVDTKVVKSKEDSNSPQSSPIRANKTQAPVRRRVVHSEGGRMYMPLIKAIIQREQKKSECNSTLFISRCLWEWNTLFWEIFILNKLTQLPMATKM